MTCEPPGLSVADIVTLTGAWYQPSEHAAPLHATVVVGATVSIWTCCDLTDSRLPAMSAEKNSTVLVVDTLKAPV